jgi:hypothetical protein
VFADFHLALLRGNVALHCFEECKLCIYARCTHEIKSRIAMAKAAFNKEKNLFSSKLDLNLRKKLISATFGA